MEVNAQGDVEMVHGKGSVRKKFMGRESQSWCGADWGKAGGCIMEVILLHL